MNLPAASELVTSAMAAENSSAVPSLAEQFRRRSALMLAWWTILHVLSASTCRPTDSRIPHAFQQPPGLHQHCSHASRADSMRAQPFQKEMSHAIHGHNVSYACILSSIKLHGKKAFCASVHATPWLSFGCHCWYISSYMGMCAHLLVTECSEASASTFCAVYSL